MKILLIEDNVNDANILKRIIAKGFNDLTLKRVETEKEFREELGNDYDIILSDYSLPDFDGMKALEIRNEEFSLMPFIIVTGSINEMTAVDCLINGADNYILKEHLGRLVPGIKKAIKDKRIEREHIEAVHALKETRIQYEQVVENAQLGILVESIEEKFVYANQKFQNIFGYDKSEISTLSYDDIVYKDDIENVNKFREKRKNEGKYQDYEIRGITKDGKIIWLQIHVETNHWKGEDNGSRFYLRDVTIEHKKDMVSKAIDEVARISLEINDLSYFVEKSYQVVSKYINVNNFFIAIYNPLKENYNFPFSINEQDQVERYESLEIKGGLTDWVRIKNKSVLFKRNDILELIEKGVITSYGTLASCWLGVPLVYNNQVIGVTGLQSYDDENAFDEETLVFIENFSSYISMKVYQQKMIQELAENEKKYSDLYIHTPNAIIVHQKGVIVMANPAALKLSGHDKMKDFIGNSILNYIHKSYKDTVNARVDAVINRKQSQEVMVETFITAKGDEIQVEVVSIPFEYQGEAAAQVIMKDVTEELLAKKLLKHSEEKFRLAFKNSLDSITITEVKTGTFYEVNDGFVNFSGYSKEEVIGKTSYEINIWYSTRDRDKLMKDIEKNGYVSNFQTKFLMKSGKVEDALVSGRTLEFEGKIYLLLTAKVITDFIRAQKELEISEQKFNQIFNSASDSIILYRIVEGFIYFHDVNEVFYKLYGYKPEDVLNKPASNIVNKKLLPKMKPNINRILNGESLIFESEHYKKNGDIFPVEISAKKIRIGENEFILAIERDITERKIAEQTIRETEDKFRKGFNSSPDAIVVINLGTGKAVEVNKGFLDLTGCSIDEIGDGKKSCFPFKNRYKTYESVMRKLMKTGEIRDVEMEIFDKGGNKHFILASASKLKINGLPHIMVIAKDISRIKHIQRQLKKATIKAEESDRLKSAFLANMSHEIRTPMNHIIGFTEFIKEGVSEDELQNYISIIQKSSQHLLELISDIIDISKVEAGLFEMNIEKINPSLMLKELYNNFCFDQRIVSNPDLELVNDVRFQTHIRIKADRVRLRQVLYNIIGNAVKFTDKGFIQYGYEERGDGMLTFYVSDSGCGISENDIPIIFDRFRQAANKPTLTSQGTGLGLALSKSFVQLMGGDIWVESTENKGSTFYFTIPLDENKKNIPINSNEIISEQLKKTKVLVIDADENEVFLITVFLNGVIPPNNIIAETDQEEIIKLIKMGKVSIVFLDISNQTQKDIDLMLKIKEIQPNLPVVAQTSYSFQSKEYNLIENGFDGILEKPFSNEKIVSALKSFLVK